MKLDTGTELPDNLELTKEFKYTFNLIDNTNTNFFLTGKAGSGKTFVLKEHMIYLTNKWILEYKSQDNIIEFDQFIKSKFSASLILGAVKRTISQPFSIILIASLMEFSVSIVSTVVID